MLLSLIYQNIVDAKRVLNRNGRRDIRGEAENDIRRA